RHRLVAAEGSAGVQSHYLVAEAVDSQRLLDRNSVRVGCRRDRADLTLVHRQRNPDVAEPGPLESLDDAQLRRDKTKEHSIGKSVDRRLAVVDELAAFVLAQGDGWNRCRGRRRGRLLTTRKAPGDVGQGGNDALRHR